MQFTKLICIIFESIAHKLQVNTDVRTVRWYENISLNILNFHCAYKIIIYFMIINLSSYMSNIKISLIITKLLNI